MIKLVLSAHPEKSQDTEIVEIDGLFEVEVIAHIGLGFRVREAGHPLEGVYGRADLFDLVLDADNGGADHLLRALGVPEAEIADAWDRHLRAAGVRV